MRRRAVLCYGLAVAVDIENFTRLDTLSQSMAPTRVCQVLDLAAARAGFDRKKWHRQLRGDGELAVLPPDTDVARALSDLPHHIAEELKNANGFPRLRLRIAMHYGTWTTGDFGPVGDAPIVACRLLDARATRRALAADADENIVVAISQRLYDDVVATRFHGLQPARFRQVRVSAKGKIYPGYLCVGSPRTLVDDPVGH